MFQIRPEERDYARLSDKNDNGVNCYGKKIDLLDGTDLPAGISLRINGDEGIGDNPNRYKQHGFHFTADNCIGCHACEAACSEKNDLPPHLSFRSVGYIEGGSYPSFTRINISMACNHCDNPVCLKGCPTRAYTKHPEYGAVIQDPNICFGCGYCTWVCPYNAPQLDPIEGQVQKCNMCVDRLEVGLKPACASACLGGALNFGVVENLPEGREQAKIDIPGFPRTDITHPNIRFQQVKSIPREFSRTDSQPIKYRQVDGTKEWRPEVDEKKIKGRQWNLKKLSSRENPLVVFTLTTQAVIGAFLMLFLGSVFGIKGLADLSGTGLSLGLLAGLIGLQSFVLFLSTQHLGKPTKFYRGFNNLKYSPLSREAAGISAFMAGLSGYAFFSFLGWAFPFVAWITTFLGALTGGFAVLAGAVGLWYMHKIYRIEARPFWNHWQVLTTFFGSMFSLGSVLVAAVAVPGLIAADANWVDLAATLGGLAAIGIAIEGIGLAVHAKDLLKQGGEGRAAFLVQTSKFGNSYIARNALMVMGFVLAIALYLSAPTGWVGLSLWALLGFALVVGSLVGRALFYVLVIPTTMPGAFFWRNKGFEEHARETGLAKLVSVGVVMDGH